MNDPNDPYSLHYVSDAGSHKDFGYGDGERLQYQNPDVPDGVEHGNAYSDRMHQWDYKKFNRCCKEVWGNEGQYFDPPARTPAQIEQFLTLYRGKPTKLIRIVRQVNVSNGFPLWFFEYYTVAE